MRRAAAIAVVLATLLAWQRLPDAQSPARGPRIPADALSAARTSGTARVIVRLNVPFTPAPPGSDRSQAQRNSIAAAQTAVLGRVTAAGRPVRSRRFSYIPYLALEVDEADLVALAAQPEVVDIRLDRVLAPSLNESLWLTGAAQAANEQYRGAGSAVAVLDTGVDAAHPYLAGHVVSEACYSTTYEGLSSSVCPGGAESSTAAGSGRPCGMFGCSHGTHVAAIAAGAGGVARDATIIAIQVFSAFVRECGADPVPCPRSFDSDLIAGLERVYALRGAYRIAAANLSLGRDVFTAACDGEPIKAIIDQLRAAGIATVAASGNDGSPVGVSVPACVSSAISVGSTTDGSSGVAADLVSTFTNSSHQLMLLAPGETITSAVPGGGFSSMNGTSQAAPHVTGAWAILKERNPLATVAQIADALVSTGVGILDPRNGLTKPRISIFSALFALPPRCTLTVSPGRIAVPRDGGSAALTVTASQPDCPWVLSLADVWWVSSSAASTTQYGSRTIALSVQPNRGSARSGTVQVSGIPITIEQAGVVAGDINGDGRADLIWQHLTSGALSASFVDRHTVGGSAPFSISPVSDTNWRIAGGGDVNGDASTDLVWQHEVSGRLAVWYLSGTQVIATLPLSIDRVADTNWKIRGVGDTNGDGFADLVWQHRTGGWLAVWLMSGTQVMETRYLSVDRVSDTDWQIAAAGDADGDGRSDIFWQHRTTGALAVWFLNGAQVTLTTRLSIDRLADTSWKLRAAGDANGDGRADLFWHQESTGALGVWYMAAERVVEQWRMSAPSVSDAGWLLAGPG